MIYIRILAFILSLTVAVTISTGCCSANKKKDNKFKSTSSNIKDNSKINKSTKRKYNKRKPRTFSKKRRTRDQQKLARLYSGLEQAEKMMENRNTEGALRAVKRIQNSVQDNPYIEMQAWYLSVQIYDKMGKKSSRKRAMRKMFDSMKKLKKHPEYQRAYNDGLACKDVINNAMKQGKGKYDIKP